MVAADSPPPRNRVTKSKLTTDHNTCAPMKNLQSTTDVGLAQKMPDHCSLRTSKCADQTPCTSSDANAALRSGTSDGATSAVTKSKTMTKCGKPTNVTNVASSGVRFNGSEHDAPRRAMKSAVGKPPKKSANERNE